MLNSPKTYKDYLREAIRRDFKSYGYLSRIVNKNGNDNGIKKFNVIPPMIKRSKVAVA